MPNITFLEPGTSATQDLSLYTGNQGAPSSGSSVSSPTKSNPRSLKLDSSLGQFANTPDGTISNAGNRIVVWVQFDGLPSAGADSAIMGDAQNSAGSSTYRIAIDSNGHLGIGSGATNLFSSGTVLATNTPYRIAVAHVITSSTNFTIKVFVTSADDTTQSVAEFTVTDADLTLTNTLGTLWQMGMNPGGTNFPNMYVHSLYIDDGTTLDDPGDIRATAKQYASTSVNNYDTAIGSATNRWDYVSERPASESNGWKQAASTQGTESYGLQAASAGDVDISSKTIVGYQSWIKAKRDLYVKSVSDTVTSVNKTTTTTFASTITVATDDLLIIGFADQIAGTAPTVAKLSGTATLGTITALTGPTTSTVRLSWWYVRVTAGGTLQLQFSHDNSSSKRGGLVVAFPGATWASPLDKNPANTSDGTSPYDTAASGTLSQSDELIIGAFAFAGPTTDTFALVTGGEAAIAETVGLSGASATSNVVLHIIMLPMDATTTTSLEMTDTTANRAGVQGIATFKTSALKTGSSKLVDNGSDVAITLTSATSVFTNIVNTSTYPSGAFGMKSTGGVCDTYFYEGGVIVAYSKQTVAPGSTLLWRHNPMQQFLVR